MTRSQLHLRIPTAEKELLREEAAQHSISMSALVRIDLIAAREARKREELFCKAYPQQVREDA